MGKGRRLGCGLVGVRIGVVEVRVMFGAGWLELERWCFGVVGGRLVVVRESVG